MVNNAPGKHFRKGMTVPQFFARFSDDAAAEAWFVEMRWPDGVVCPHRDCTSVQDGHNIRPLDTDKQMASVAAGMVGKTLPYRRLVDA